MKLSLVVLCLLGAVSLCNAQTRTITRTVTRRTVSSSSSSSSSSSGAASGTGGGLILSPFYTINIPTKHAIDGAKLTQDNGIMIMEEPHLHYRTMDDPAPAQAAPEPQMDAATAPIFLYRLPGMGFGGMPMMSGMGPVAAAEHAPATPPPPPVVAPSALAPAGLAPIFLYSLPGMAMSGMGPGMGMPEAQAAPEAPAPAAQPAPVAPVAQTVPGNFVFYTIPAAWNGQPVQGPTAGRKPCNCPADRL